MRTRSVLAGAIAATCLLAACGSTHAVNTLGTTSTTGAKGAAASGSATTAKAASGSSTTAKTGSGSSTTAKAAAPSSSASAAGSSAGSSSTAKAGTEGAVGTAKVEVAKTALGQVLADGEGRTLYLYKKDTQGKASTCDGSCAVTWPPVEATDKPTAGTGIDAAKLTTVKRADGTEQVAYDGWPLYRYDGDKNAGDTTGEGVNSVWYAVSPAGAPIAA